VGTHRHEIYSRVTDSTDEDLRRIAVEVYGGAADDAAGEEYAPSSTIDVGGYNSDPEMDGRGRIHEDRGESPARPIDRVLLHVTEDGGNDDSVSTFELVPMCDDDGAVANVVIVDTPLGPFRRHKMSICRVDGEGDAIFPNAKATALVRFRDDASSALVPVSIRDPGDIALSVDSLSLPAIMRGDASCDAYDEVGIELPPRSTFPPKEWRWERGAPAGISSTIARRGLSGFYPGFFVSTSYEPYIIALIRSYMVMAI
jgi:hypothetical protein